LRRTDGDGLAGSGPQCLRHLIADGNARAGIFPRASRIAVAAEPAVGFVFVGIARRVPDLGGAEMRTVRVGIADTLHNGGLTLTEQCAEIFQRWM